MPHTLVYIHPAKHRQKIPKLTAFDKLIMVVSALYPLSGVPQIIAVFSGNVTGVSAWSWGMFLLCTSLYLVYGIKRRVPPMIISNSVWVIVDSLVVIGILVHSS